MHNSFIVKAIQPTAFPSLLRSLPQSCFVTGGVKFGEKDNNSDTRGIEKQIPVNQAANPPGPEAKNSL